MTERAELTTDQIAVDDLPDTVRTRRPPWRRHLASEPDL